MWGRSSEDGFAEAFATLVVLAVLGLPIEWLALVIGSLGVALGGMGLHRLSSVVDRFDELNAALGREVSTRPPDRPSAGDE